MNRAYSILEIKSVDDEAWIVEGIATTPTADRYGDIVEPMGAKYSVPMPLLWQHNSQKPVGEVEFAKPTKSGIPFRAHIKKASLFTSETLRERALEAWESVKTGLVRAVSIGFKELEYSFMDDGGIHFKEWEWLELSLVTIPANADATIHTIKQYDKGAPAAPGNGASSSNPPAPGHVTVKAIQPKPEGGKMTIKEQIQQFEATRQAKAARRDELMKTAADKGETLDAEQEEEYETIKTELVAIDKHLVRLNEQEAENVAKAKPVDGTNTEAAAKSRSTVQVALAEKPEPGIRFARFAMAMLASKGDTHMALSLMQTHYPQEKAAITVLKTALDRGQPVHKMIGDIGEYRAKAAVPAGDTSDATWASPLLAYNEFTGDFLEYLRPQTIVGQFGTDGIPSLRAIPFNVHIKGRTSGGTGYWVGEGAPKPVTAYDFNDTYHGWTKAAAISVLTEDLIRFSNPSAEQQVRSALSETIIERLDTDFVDPTVAAVTGVNPAAITNGVTPIASSDTDADGVAVDLAALWAAALAANLPLTSAVYITTPAIALNLSLMRNALGNREFPDMSMRGGTLNGVRVIVSNYVDAGLFILAFASEIWLSDDGVVTIDASREASLQMLDNPTNTPIGTTVATTMVSMFQTNSVAFRAERFIHWSKRRTTAVAMLENVAWGPGAGSVA